MYTYALTQTYFVIYNCFGDSPIRTCKKSGPKCNVSEI